MSQALLCRFSFRLGRSPTRTPATSHGRWLLIQIRDRIDRNAKRGRKNGNVNRRTFICGDFARFTLLCARFRTATRTIKIALLAIRATLAVLARFN